MWSQAHMHSSGEWGWQLPGPIPAAILHRVPLGASHGRSRTGNRRAGLRDGRGRLQLSAAPGRESLACDFWQLRTGFVSLKKKKNSEMLLLLSAKGKRKACQHPGGPRLSCAGSWKDEQETHRFVKDGKQKELSGWGVSRCDSGDTHANKFSSPQWQACRPSNQAKQALERP